MLRVTVSFQKERATFSEGQHLWNIPFPSRTALMSAFGALSKLLNGVGLRVVSQRELR